MSTMILLDIQDQKKILWILLKHCNSRLVICTSRTVGSAKKFVRMHSLILQYSSSKKENFNFWHVHTLRTSSWTLLHQNRKLSSQISLQNQLFCLCRLPAVNYNVLIIFIRFSLPIIKSIESCKFKYIKNLIHW
jgi:hypothetical protein